MNGFFNLLKNIAEGAMIVILALVALSACTMGILLIPYLLLVIFSFIFIRPFMSGKRSLLTCLKSLTKFFVINVLKFILITAGICAAGTALHFGWISFNTEWEFGFVGSAVIIGVLPMAFGAWATMLTLRFAEKIFAGTWKDYTSSLTGRY